MIWLLEFVKPLYLQCKEWSFKLYRRIRESLDVIRIWNIKLCTCTSYREVLFLHYTSVVLLDRNCAIAKCVWYCHTRHRLRYWLPLVLQKSSMSTQYYKQPYLLLALAQSHWFFVLAFSLLIEFAIVCNIWDARQRNTIKIEKILLKLNWVLTISYIWYRYPRLSVWIPVGQSRLFYTYSISRCIQHILIIIQG